MTFLSPALLWFLAAAGIPIAIHLLNKRRHKTVPWAAMQFLLKATRESRGKKKLRHILILLCRALAIAALATAAARPVVSGLVGWGAGSIDQVVLILDRSASMDLRASDGEASKREIVIQRVRDSLKNLGNPQLILLDSASQNPTEIPSPDALPELSLTAGTDTAAHFPALLERAAEFLQQAPGRSEVWLASDMQLSNWQASDERWASARASLAALPQKPAIRVLSLTGNSAKNTALRILGTQRHENGITLDLEFIRSENSRSALTIPFTTVLNGASSSQSMTLSSQSLRFQKRLSIADPEESGWGYVSIPADGNNRDNIAYFAYGPVSPSKTLIISPENEAATYLSLAAAPPGFEAQEVERKSVVDFSGIPLREYALILWASNLPNQNDRNRLEKFLQEGGQIIFLPNDTNSEADFLGMSWQDVSLADPGKFFILGTWDRSDGPLRDGEDGTSIPAERLRAIKRAVPEGDAAVMARWEDDEPFLTRTVVDRGTFWFLGSLPDYTWSNLGDADVLLPVIQRILTKGADRFGSSFLAETGDKSTVPKAGETKELIDAFQNNNEPAAAQTHRAGVYRLGERILAVNRPPAEDAPEVTTPDLLDVMLDGTGYTLLDQQGNASETPLSTDIWRYFLIAMLLLLISEAILSLPGKQKANHPLTKAAA